ncbi:MAG: hypothetical protein ACO1OB_01820 [Archangium sp.]
MIRALLLSLVVLTACGRGEFEAEDLALQQQQQNLAGTYEFGPMVGKGLPPADETITYPTSRLATLELKPDGTFSLEFGMGCVISWHDGTWAPTRDGAHLTFGLNPGWTDASGNTLKVDAIDVTATEGGLTVTGTSNRGAISQKWEVAR